MDSRDLSPLEQGEFLQDLARSLVSVMPRGWQQLTYLARPIGGLNEHVLAVQGADGQVSEVELPDDAHVKATALKKAGFQEGKGSWLSMVMSVHHSGQMNVEYNHDAQPDISPVPSPLIYLQELRRFPRPQDQIPDWMREQLHLARQMDVAGMTEEFCAAVAQACAREGLHAEYLRPSHFRISAPGAGVLLESDLATTIDSALISPADHRPALAAHFAGYVARHARRQGLLGEAPHAQPAPSNQGAPGDPLSVALVSAFREGGAQASFQDPNTLVLRLQDGNNASTDISGFRSQLEGASPEQIAQHTSGFARAALEQISRQVAQGQRNNEEGATADSGRLRVRLYPVNAFPEGVLDKLLSRQIAPGLWQTVVVDSPETLQPLSRVHHERSGRPDGEVFAEAVAGALGEAVEVSEHGLDGTEVVHIGAQHPYVAAHAHALDRYVGESPYGSLVAFPVPEVILAHPLGKGHPIAAMDHLQELAARFTGDAEKPISPQLYWWHPNSRGRAQGEPLDLRPVGITMDHENRSVSLHTGDEEFAALLNSLTQQG
ncbi:hypothetical protein [Nocardiopsis metallicus]|uniref:Uncharacterized protein n=1 Tax=Nocardiopsis metallicus TaxID=179819 RepID=A0A840W1E8_9ACTN|nr:hypothetical protein [Nocardiopsis metallicus]MBB5489804.1 hypothetical protein [Nocardiopsis metallicus]